MESASIFGPVNDFPGMMHRTSRAFLKQKHSTSVSIPRSNGNNHVKDKKLSSRTSAVAELSAVTSSDPAQVEITWQIVGGSLAGITPFVVAGIEFSKRILQQRQCGVCKGSGLVQMDDQSYVRCPGCGGFLPWQSWRRFFTG